jgi:flavin reductase (DIM6/NTAB) family NADH-FMN oxidoreductase RutF
VRPDHRETEALVERALAPVAADGGRSPLDLDDVRAFHRGYPTGVTVVTAMGATAPKGLAVNAFASLTLEPPRVLVCIATSAQSYETLFRARSFAVNVLAADQAAIARLFATSGGDKFSQIAWAPGAFGAPVLEGCARVVEAELDRRLEVGSHTVFVGTVIDVRISDRPPLVYWEGQLWEPHNLRALG